MIVIRRPDIMIGAFSGAFSAVRKLSLLTRTKLITGVPAWVDFFAITASY
jgi:hypothetical protein